MFDGGDYPRGSAALGILFNIDIEHPFVLYMGTM